MARSKDASMVTAAAPFQPYAALSRALLGATHAGGPADHGTVSMLVQRPALNERRVVPEVELSVDGGMAGSGWALRPERGLVDQVCVMSTAAIRAIAGGDRDAWPAAGDQIFMDLDLARDNFSTGDRVRVGDVVVLEVTEKPHNGCAKFEKRYGKDALKVVNQSLGKERRLRGIYFKVVQGGVVKNGDEIVKIGREG